MNISNATMFQYQGVVGYAYHNPGNTRAIIWCKGGPSLGDDGESEVFSQASKELGVSIIVPDYLGSGRSAGSAFTIQRAVQTIAICEDFLANNQPVVDCWSNTKIAFDIKEIVLVGHSWGATMAALYPKFYPETLINQIAFLSGVLNYDPIGHIEHGGESDLEFWQQIENGWTNYYRSIRDSDWKELVIGGDHTHDPSNNLQALVGKNIKIIHGKKDKVIAHQRSEQFTSKLKQEKIASKLTLTNDDHFSVVSVKILQSLIKS